MKIILIVDDEYDIASSLEMLFSLEGYEVRIAYDGNEALELLKIKPYPDAILTDLMMPQMDGYTFVKTFKAQEEYLHIPAILASAAQLDPTRIEKHEYVAFMRKPFDLDHLIDTVKKVVSNSM